MVQGKGFTPKELPSTCLSYPTRPSVHVPTRELASAARSYPSSGKTSIYQGPRRWLRFHEKGGKEYEMPAHHEIEETIDEYLSKVSIDDNQPLFQSVNKAGTALSGRALNRHNAWAAIRKRARNAGFLTRVGCHT